MQERTKELHIRVTPHEQATLKEKARAHGMTLSEYVRLALIHSENGTINVIDTDPLRRAVYELSKQGTNLNQLMKFYNTYGGNAYDAKWTGLVLSREARAYEKVIAALSSLQRESEKSHIHLLGKEESP